MAVIENREPIVKFQIKVVAAEYAFDHYIVSVTVPEARRIASELISATGEALCSAEPSYRGIRLSDEAWGKLEDAIRAAKRKKQTKKPKKSKPKQEPVVAPKRKK